LNPLETLSKYSISGSADPEYSTSRSTTDAVNSFFARTATDYDLQVPDEAVDLRSLALLKA
jgi:hypothetical protein